MFDKLKQVLTSRFINDSLVNKNGKTARNLN